MGRRNISRFLTELARPHVAPDALDEGYRAMAADNAREREAKEWADGLIGDAKPSCRSATPSRVKESRIAVPPLIAAKLTLHDATRAVGLTAAALAERLAVSEPTAARSWPSFPDRGRPGGARESRQADRSHRQRGMTR